MFDMNTGNDGIPRGVVKKEETFNKLTQQTHTVSGQSVDYIEIKYYIIL